MIAILDTSAYGNVITSNIQSTGITAGQYSPYSGSGIGFGNGVYMPRLSIPTSSNKYFIKYTYGGFNQAIAINRSSGWVLPNCVGYAWGRVYELCAIWGCTRPTRNSLSVGDAYTFWNINLSRHTYAYGQTPRLGAIICFRGHTQGHVAIVERINFSGADVFSIEVSQSAYGGAEFTVKTLYAYQNYQYKSGYVLQGFIYPSYVSYYSNDAGKQYAEGDTASASCGLVVLTVLRLNTETGNYEYVTTPSSDYTDTAPGIEAGPTYPTNSDTTPTAYTFKCGDKVKAIKMGNSSKLGTGKDVVATDVIYQVKSIHKEFPYPYRIGTENRGYGYFKQDSLVSAG